MANLKLRKDDDIFLIGKTSNEICGAKLPSIGQVLSRFFFGMRENRLSVKESASVTVEEVFQFWIKARIPTCSKVKCVRDIERLYERWRSLQKTKNRNSDFEVEARENFKESLKNLFDIASPNALEEIKTEEDKAFLIAQRKPGREGSMIGIDRQLFQQEKRKRERLEKEEERKKRYMEEKESSSK
jgi:hypothetical protein